MTEHGATLVYRFWAKVNKNGPIVRPELGPCWIWIGGSGTQGRYGEIRVNGKMELTHIISWQLAGFELPDGADVCHECDNGLCIRPDHLFLGNAKTNSQDMISKGRDPHGEHSGRAKLTEVQVMDIIESLNGGVNYLEIAEVYGVSPKTISHIKTGYRWKYLRRTNVQET
jgi:hypothetical protein